MLLLLQLAACLPLWQATHPPHAHARAPPHAQGQLESTSAEVEQLQAHLQGARAEGEALLALKQELEGALAGARSDGEGLRQQLSAVSAALQAHQTAQAQLEAKHKALQAQARAVHEQLGDARARAERLEKQLALREAELQAEQARLLSHLQGQAREADQTTQLSQHIKAADNAVINAQRQSIEQLAGQLDGDRQVHAMHEDGRRKAWHLGGHATVHVWHAKDSNMITSQHTYLPATPRHTNAL